MYFLIVFALVSICICIIPSRCSFAYSNRSSYPFDFGIRIGLSPEMKYNLGINNNGEEGQADGLENLQKNRDFTNVLYGGIDFDLKRIRGCCYSLRMVF